MSAWPDPIVDGTLISSPETGILYFSPHRYRDGAAGFRERREDFSVVGPGDPFLARLRARANELGYDDIPQSPGEYVELA